MENNNNLPEEQKLSDSKLTADLPKTHTLSTIVWALAVVLILASAGFGYWQFSENAKLKKAAEVSLTNNTPTPPIDNNEAVPPTDANSTPTTSDSYDPFSNRLCQNRLATAISKSGQVDWQEPKKLPNTHLFAKNDDPNNQVFYNDIVYKVGTIKTGKYAGGEFLLVLTLPDGPAPYGLYRIIHHQDNYYYLPKYSTAFLEEKDGAKYAVKITTDNTFELADLNFPKTLQGVNPKANFTYATSLGFFQNGTELFCADNLIKAFTDPDLGDVYADPDPATAFGIQTATPPSNYYPRFGYYIKSPDGTQHTYTLNIDFIGNDKIPLVSWTNGKKNSAEYAYQAIGGCGASKFQDEIDVKSAELVQIGTTLSGDPIFGYKNTNSDALKGMYESTYVPEGKTKQTYATFLANHPIFFWKNPFGYFVQFKNTSYLPLAECAKPVIYLYPQENTKVHVRVNPLGGMLVSEPEYKQGWSVLAKPNGALTNLADGKTYPYLFWEGRTSFYVAPERGFVVEKKDVSKFLDEKLLALGLNNKESEDFKGFWLPKMQAAPYYFVTFMENYVIDQLAPLTITPKPDTIIRVLMDFAPLEKPIPVTGFTIRTPERKGFTVVEWGGVLRNDQE